MLLTLFIFLASLAILLKGADVLVEAAKKIAHRSGVSEFIIGLTIVAIGTSLPELATAVMSALKGTAEVAAGIVMGSNIANIGLILGTASVLTVMNAKKHLYHKDTLFLMAISILWYLFALNRTISQGEGSILLIIFVMYTLMLIKDEEKKRIIAKELGRERKRRAAISDYVKEVLLITIGSVMLYLGAKYVIISTADIAASVQIPQEIIAFSAIALGTSLPELMVTIAAARKKQPNLLMGNLIGSNIANILLVGGAAALLRNIPISSFDLAVAIPLMILVVVVLIRYMQSKWFTRMALGSALLLLYVLFLLGLIVLYSSGAAQIL